MKAAAVCACLALLACAPPWTAPVADAPQSDSVYERYAELADDPAVQAKLAAPAQRIRDFAWLIGEWNVTVTIAGGAPEAGEPARFSMRGEALIVDDDLSFVLGYDGFADRWFSAGFEPPAAPMTQSFSATPWDGSQIVFQADARILGERYALRQTLRKLSEDSFELINEQLVAPGRYREVDRYRYDRLR